MNAVDLERARIRALAVLRMNYFNEQVQKYQDRGDEESEHVWAMARNAISGLIKEIDSGTTVTEIRGVR